MNISGFRTTGGGKNPFPGCKACGIIRHISRLIGNLVKHNGSISGAAAGCRGEVGSECAMAAGAAAFAVLSDGKHMISFDEVVDTMMQTGMDLSGKYRETSTGGLASFYNRDELEDTGRS